MSLNLNTDDESDKFDRVDMAKAREERVRDVSAFANACGGVIIYSIAENSKEKGAYGIHGVTNVEISFLRITQII
ncbi:MAG: hypothetical protein K0R08_1880 [Solimicrobium sp.]|jgi:hypothetical protein|nr:hypothetical protein [Solimicrobium sp.]